ncbi:MAG: D-alanyl-D-alanine carboxypeptidase [bacterium]|nr:D-alanyl-D-alanine carboxypeptidase [bacterium]
MTGRDRPVGSSAAVTLAVVLVLLIPPSAVHGAPDDGLTSAAHQASDRLAADLSAVLSLRQTPASTCVSATLDDHSLIEERFRESLVPASLAKVVTAAAALEVIRPDEVFSTEVVAGRDAIGSIAGGVLKGDIYLIGRGDPVLSTPRYAGRYDDPVAHTDITELADRVYASLAALGVTRIEGGLVGDETWFPDKERDYTGDRHPLSGDPVWKTSYVTSNDAGPLSALLLNGGFSSYSEALSSAGRRRYVRAEDPSQYAASVFDDLLEARGMVITQRPRSGVSPAPGERSSLGTIESPPVSEILARMLSRSDNTIAEMLLKEIGRRTLGSDRASATAAVHEILNNRLGALAEGLVVVDGSGLSYSNRLTCAAVTELLRESGPGSPLVDGLAIAGETGTLKSCGPVRSSANDDPLNTVRAKTGTLNDVTALAGTTVAANGEVLTFTMIANAPAIILLGHCNRLRRTLLDAAANYTYWPPPSGIPDHAGDRAALVALFESTGGDAWFNTWRWSTGAPLGQWHGVTTDSAGRVTGIDLSGPFGNGLTGSIPEEIGSLTELVHLDLSGNDLRGRIPEQISGLTKLSMLQLRGTGLCIPGSLQNLPFLYSNEAGTGVERCRKFIDTPGNTHEAALDTLETRGILAGTECAPDHVCPDEPIERWTMAVWLVRANDRWTPSGVEATRFADVDADAWWAPYVERLASLRVTIGCTDRPLRYCPDDPVTRAQMASFLVRLLDLDPAPSAGFTDTAGNPHEVAIDALAAAGLTDGCRSNPLSYCPAQPVSRAQMATFIARSLGLA